MYFGQSNWNEVVDTTSADITLSDIGENGGRDIIRLQDINNDGYDEKIKWLTDKEVETERKEAYKSSYFTEKPGMTDNIKEKIFQPFFRFFNWLSNIPILTQNHSIHSGGYR